MTFNLKPHEVEAYRLILDKKQSDIFQKDILVISHWEVWGESERLALKLAFDIARKTLEQFPQLKKQLLLEKEKTDD